MNAVVSLETGRACKSSSVEREREREREKERLHDVLPKEERGRIASGRA